VHEYDTVLKSLLQDSKNSSIFEQITGARPSRWINVEFPEVQQTRVDLLVETADLRLINIELQSTNDSLLPLRMAEYALRVYRLYKRFPQQYVLYVGDAEMRLPCELAGTDFQCRYIVKDIRAFDEEALLGSLFASDSILAILTRHKDRRETIRRILRRIATLEAGARELAYSKLMILAGLRRLAKEIQTEVEQMPILNDIMDHEIIGPAIRQGMHKGELTMLRGLLAKRFGRIPNWADERLSNLSSTELEALSLRFLDVNSLDELFER